MNSAVEGHYSAGGRLADRIAAKLTQAGKDIRALTTADLAPVDEFHIRGRKATLELGAKMNLRESSHVLDLGSGLGGPARTLAETYGCAVTGVDLTQEFCDAANAMSEMLALLTEAGFRILETEDSSAESLSWFQHMATRMAESGPPPVSFQMFFGDQFPDMARNQVRNLAEGRIRTMTYLCEA